MLNSRSSHELRMLALVTAAACVLCAPMIVSAAGSTAAPSATKSTTVTKSHGKAATSEERSELNEHLQKMTERLKLTDDQVAKVRAIMQSKATQMDELRAKYKGELDTPENRAAMEKAHKELHADIEAKFARVLTADQMNEYKKMSAEHMKREGEKEEKEEAAKGTQK